MTLRSLSLTAGLSLAAAFVLALPLSAQAGAHCNCGAMAHSSAMAHASAMGHVQTWVHASASGWSHSGGDYAVHTVGYDQGSYPRHVMRYADHTPEHYPDHDQDRDWNRGGNYAHDDGNSYHRDDDDHGLNNRFSRGNSYALVYSPTYADTGYGSDYSGGGYGYAARGSDYVPTQDYGEDYVPPQPAYNDSAYDGSRAIYDDSRYGQATYNGADYALPPARTCGCSQPYEGTTVAYGWRDQYGAWHASSERSHYSYSYRY